MAVVCYRGVTLRVVFPGREDIGGGHEWTGRCQTTDVDPPSFFLVVHPSFLRSLDQEPKSWVILGPDIARIPTTSFCRHLSCDHSSTYPPRCLTRSQTRSTSHRGPRPSYGHSTLDPVW